jgi:hypothetical protein
MSDQLQWWDGLVLGALVVVLWGISACVGQLWLLARFWRQRKAAYAYRNHSAAARRPADPSVARAARSRPDVSAATPLCRDRASRGTIDLDQLYGYRDTTRLEMDAEGRRRQYLEKLR